MKAFWNEPNLVLLALVCVFAVLDWLDEKYNFTHTR